MSNKRAFAYGIATAFGINIALNIISDIVEKRVLRYMQKYGIYVGVGIMKNANNNKDAKENEKEGS